MPRFPTRLALAALATCLMPTTLLAQSSGYKTPPDAIAKILDSPGAPVVSTSPDRRWLLITSSDIDDITIDELAQPTLFLAGRRVRTNPIHNIELVGVRSARIQPLDGGADITIDVPAGARLTTPQWSNDSRRLAYFNITADRMGLRVFEVASRRTRAITASGLTGRLAAPQGGGWSRDGRHFLFTSTTPAGASLWVADTDAGTARRLTPNTINFVTGGCGWSAGRAPAVCLLFPAGRGAEPKAPAAPSGPIVQESFGRSAPTRTNTYLLRDTHDEALFDHLLFLYHLPS